MQATIIGTPQNRARVLLRDRVTAEDVKAVAEGDALAILVEDYYGRRDATLLAERLLRADSWTTYDEETGAAGIGTLGRSLFGCLGQELCPEYFDEGVEMHRKLRRIVHPFMLPADRVQLELDHLWPSGAGLLHIGGRAAFLGLVRAFREGGEAMSHTDRADWDYPSPETAALRAQLFLNIYLSKSAEGGAVRLWDAGPATKAEYDALRLAPDHYALDAAALPPHAVEIEVPVGSLLIANAWRTHAVTGAGGGGTRLSVSGFIGYESANAPLRLFS